METADQLIFKAAGIREKGGLKITRNLDSAFYAGITDRHFSVKSARVDLVFSVGSDSILLEAKASAELNLECARCGKFFPAAFAEPFDEVYEDTVESIDVREPALEALALMAPMKPLCGAACKGLCPVCGCDLNKKACGCKIAEEPKDESGKTSPFMALKDFKEKKKAK